MRDWMRDEDVPDEADYREPSIQRIGRNDLGFNKIKDLFNTPDMLQREANAYDIIIKVWNMFKNEYSWKRTRLIGNEQKANVKRYYNSDIRISFFKTFMHASMAFGEALHYPWENRAPTGSRGFANCVIIPTGRWRPSSTGRSRIKMPTGDIEFDFKSFYPKTRTVWKSKKLYYQAGQPVLPIPIDKFFLYMNKEFYPPQNVQPTSMLGTRPDELQKGW